MRLFDYAVRNAAPIRLALDHGPGAGSGSAARRRGHASARHRHGRSARRAHRAAGVGRREPRHPAGVLPRRARLGPRGADGGGRRPAATAGVLRQRDDHRRPHPPLLAAERARLRSTARCPSTTRGVRLDDLAATMGGGRVQFGGRIGFDGYLPGELNVTVRGEDMQLRLLEGRPLDGRRRSRARRQLPGADARRHGDGEERDLDAAHRRAGQHLRLRARARRPADRSLSARRRRRPCPLRFDVRIQVPSTLRVETNLARLVASADLTLQGTYDRPVIFGHAEIERGEVKFEGRRYRITRGAIDFTNPTRIEPFFDIEAETNVRVPGPRSRPIASRRVRRHDRAAAADAELGSPAADRRRAGAALQRRAPRQPRTSSCARCRTRTRRRPTSWRRAPRRR